MLESTVESQPVLQSTAEAARALQRALQLRTALVLQSTRWLYG